MDVALRSRRHSLGADFGPLTLDGQWWRLFTSMFVHYGIVHIAFNMWCFWDLGCSLEFLMGREAFAATYVASGLAASSVSLYWHPWSVAAGASGAIFGIAGAFASYLLLKKIPLAPAVLKRTRNSLAVFIVYNLISGAAHAGVDNSAHVGGLIAGAIIGAIVPPVIRMHTTGSGVADGTRAAPAIEDVSDDGSRANRIAWGIIAGSAIVLMLSLVEVHSVRSAYAKYGNAAQLIRSDHIDAAIDQLRQVTQAEPDFLPAQMLLGEVLLDDGNPSAAVPVLEQALALDPGSPQIQQNLALAYLGAGKTAQALAQIEVVLANQKNHSWDALFIRGVGEGEAGQVEHATQDLQTVAEDNPNFPEARSDLAQLQPTSPRIKDADHRPAPLIPYSDLIVRPIDWPLFP